MDKHVCDIFMEFQPKYAKYTSWDNEKYKDERREQAIREMVSEANEVFDIVTKVRRHENHIPRARVVDELSDVLWGLVGIMNEFDISWEELIEFNINKLDERNNESS